MHERCTHLVVLALSSFAAIGAGCGRGSSPSLPLVTPPVLAATPAALRASSYQGSTLTMAVAPGTVDLTGEFKARFFSPSPTSVFDILASIDARISDVNGRSSTSTCLTQAAVPFSLDAWGQSVPFYAQCFVEDAASSIGSRQFMQWAQVAGVTYLYYSYGAERLAVTATPVAGGYAVHAWIGIGYANAVCNAGSGGGTWDGCSYGVLELVADDSTHGIELAVAGIGFGYCGAQLRADGARIYGIGSNDGGATCGAPRSVCVAAADLTPASDCGASVTRFSLAALGRESAQGSNVPPINGQDWAASLYPVTGPSVWLDGTATDDLSFGPSAPTPGAGAF